MSKNKSILQRAIEAANEQREDQGDKPYDVVPYSGRFMYGKSCLGVKVDSDDFGSLIADIAQQGAAILNNTDENDLPPSPREYQDFYRQLADIRWDSLGLGMIVYFKSTQFVESEDESDDEDDGDEDTDE